MRWDGWLVGKLVRFKKKKQTKKTSPGNDNMLREMPVGRPESGEVAGAWEEIKINPVFLKQNKQEKEARG